MMDQPYKEKELFAAALALPAIERAHYLGRVCSDDSDLLRRLQFLLDSAEDAARFVNDHSNIWRDGIERIGPYRIVQELGEGGCGVAYLAEQTAPIKRQVALKVIKPGMDTKAVIARFEAERQALAMMDHPNVAKVFDAGTTSSGRPYFVMELVRGIRITDYCNHSRFTVRERISLFIQVCQAIQHAHLKGIIHRDIKPSNVLVTMHDGAPIAKVIDFGIAKAMQGRLTDSTVHTIFEQFVGTPAYVSPEQISPGSADVDTRSDIYSLGVLLYELLTGCTPSDVFDLTSPEFDRIRRLVHEGQHIPPSKRLSILRQQTAFHGALRGRAHEVIKEIQVDIDWIVMRCLESEPHRRYQTANELILDLQRYLNEEPVLARPPSFGYVIGKFARRQRALFAASLAGVCFVLFLATFAVIASVQAKRIAAERERAEQELHRAEMVSDFMVKIFDAPQPLTSLGRDISAREALDEAARRIRGDLQQHPDVRAQILTAIGGSYRRLGAYQKAIPYLQDALSLRRRLPDQDGTKTAHVLWELSLASTELGDVRQADAYARQGLKILRERGSERSRSYTDLLTMQAHVHLQMGDLSGARRHAEASVRLAREVSGHTSEQTADALMQLAMILLWSDDLQGAERMARQAVEVNIARVTPDHPFRAHSDALLGEVLALQGRFAEATPLLENALTIYERTHAPDTVYFAEILDFMADLKRSQGQLTEAEGFARRALRAAESSAAGETNGVGVQRAALGVTLALQGKYQEAENLLRQSLAIYGRTLPSDHEYVAASKYWLGEVLLATGRLADAESNLVASIDLWNRAGAPSWRAARSRMALGDVYERQGRATDAEQYVSESYRTLIADPRVDPETLTRARDRIVRFYSTRGEPKRGRDLLSAVTSSGT